MILVTGATGHIGNVLVRELLARGEQVRVLILPGEDCAPLDGLEVECVEGNVLDPASLKRAFEGVSVAYHLAGVICILPGANPFVDQVNVEGTRNILTAARQAGVRRLVYTSSIHAFQRARHGVLIDESLPFDPQTAAGCYDRSKARASLVVQEAARSGLDAVIVCPTGVIGPYDFRRSEMGHLILSGINSPVQFCVDGAYDFVDVRDVARGLILACEKGRRGETYILSGEQITLSAMLGQVRALSGRGGPLVNIPFWLARIAAAFTPFYCRLTGKPPQFTQYSLEVVLSNSRITSAKARRELGYAPRPLRESIADTVRWWLDHQRGWSRGAAN